MHCYWIGKQIIAPNNCSFIIGNPPFQGAKPQDDEKRAIVRPNFVVG